MNNKEQLSAFPLRGPKDDKDLQTLNTAHTNSYEIRNKLA